MDTNPNTRGSISSQAEQDLFCRIQSAGSLSASDSIAIHDAYSDLAYKLARQMCARADLLEDFKQEAIVALYETVQLFDPDQGARFSTFATHRIRGRLLDYIKSESKHNGLIYGYVGRTHDDSDQKSDTDLQGIEQHSASEVRGLKQLSPTSVTTSYAPVVDKEVDRLTTQEKLDTVVPLALSVLTEQQQRVIVMLYWQDLRPLQIASELGVSPPRVTALKKSSHKRMQPLMAQAA